MMKGKMVQKVVRLGAVANRTEGNKRFAAFCRNYSAEKFREILQTSRPDCPTLNQYVPRYLQEAEGVILNSCQGLNTPTCAAKHLQRHLGHLKLTEILPSEIDDYVRLRRKETIKHCKVPNYRKLPAPKSINNELILLSAIVQFAVDRDIIEAHTFRTSRRPLSSYFLKVDKRPGTYLTPDDKRALMLAAVGQPYAQVVMQVLWWTGLRRGELSQLRWEHIDLNARNIQVFADKTSDTRTIPVPDALYPLLVRLKSERATRIAWVPRKEHQKTYLFCHTNGRPIAEPGKFLKNMAIRAGLLKKVTTHTCRHTFITELRNSGLNPWEVMTLTGHKNVTTLENYGANVPIGIREKVNGVFGRTSLDPGLTRPVENESKVIKIEGFQIKKMVPEVGLEPT